VEDQKKKAEAGDATEEAQESSLAPVAKDAGQSSSPHVKLTGNANDAEMMKPADLSDAEPHNDNEMEGDANAKKIAKRQKSKTLRPKRRTSRKCLKKNLRSKIKRYKRHWNVKKSSARR
jgi:hypothetical protein